MPSTGFFLANSTQAFSPYTEWNNPNAMTRCNLGYASGDYAEFEALVFRTDADGNIPDGSTLDGVEMEVTGKRNAGSPLIFHWLSRDGINLSSTSFSYTWSSATPSTQTFGSSTNKWGLDITFSTGGVLYGVIGNFGISSTADYDCMRLNIYYTLPPSPPTVYTFKSGNYEFKSGNTIYK